VRARLAAHRGDTETGESLALEAVSVANETDALNFQGRSLMALAEVLLIGRRREDASEVVGEAVRAFEEKGNIAAAARARELMSSPVTA
jgi:hypothetical protein